MIVNGDPDNRVLGQAAKGLADLSERELAVAAEHENAAALGRVVVCPTDGRAPEIFDMDQLPLLLILYVEIVSVVEVEYFELLGVEFQISSLRDLDDLFLDVVDFHVTGFSLERNGEGV
jgi:hypothetical protein